MTAVAADRPTEPGRHRLRLSDVGRMLVQLGDRLGRADHRRLGAARLRRLLVRRPVRRVRRGLALRPAGAPGPGLRGCGHRMAGGRGRGRRRPGDRDAPRPARRGQRPGQLVLDPGGRDLDRLAGLHGPDVAGRAPAPTRASRRRCCATAVAARPCPTRRWTGWCSCSSTGCPDPVARWALQSGTMPTLRRWLDDGSHELREWTVRTPCTTPASQQGDPAGHHRRGAGVPLVRPRARSRPRGQPSGRRRRHRGARDLGRGTARGPWGLGLEPVLRGRGAQHDDDEPGRAHARVPRHPADRGPLRAEAGRLHPQRLPDRRRGGPRALPGPPAAAPRRRAPGGPALDVRPAPGGDQRGAAGPQHRRRRPGDAEGHAERLRRLRGLRRGRPPRGMQPDRVAPGPAGPRRGAEAPRDRRAGGTASLPLRDPLRPRPVPGTTVRRGGAQPGGPVRHPDPGRRRRDGRQCRELGTRRGAPRRPVGEPDPRDADRDAGHDPAHRGPGQRGRGGRPGGPGIGEPGPGRTSASRSGCCSRTSTSAGPPWSPGWWPTPGSGSSPCSAGPTVRS